MTKKLICFPFVDGNLQSYVHYELSDQDRKRVYDGENVVTERFSQSIEWRANAEVDLTLTYVGYGRGRSAVVFYWKDEQGHGYPMFIKDFDELLKLNIGTSSIRAIYTYVKRGANYGIKFLRKVEDNQSD